MSAPVLLVLGDSLAFHGPRTAHPANDDRLWPHVAASVLGGTAELHAGIGWTARHGWRAVAGDPRVWASVARADALVLGLGGMDSLPSPVPTALRELIPLVRPAALRRRVRGAYGWSAPALARLSARVAGGWPTALSAAETVRHLERCRLAVTTLRPGLPVVALRPAVHRSAAHGGVHPGLARHDAAIRRWAVSHGVTTVPTASLVGEHVLGGHGNPDGIHWGWDAHRMVGEAVGEAVAAAVLAG